MVCQLPTEPCFYRCPRRDSNPQSLGLSFFPKRRSEPLSQLAYRGVQSSVIPDGLEPLLSGCRPEVVAAGPRDQSKVDSSGIAPRIQFDGARFAGPMSSCWTMSPTMVDGRGLMVREDISCHQPLTISHRPNCGSWNRTNASGFRAQHRYQQRQSRKEVESQGSRVQSQRRGSRLRLIWLLTLGSPLLTHLRGQESNLRTRGSKPRISTSRNYPASCRGTGGTRTHARVLNKHRHAVAFNPPSAVCR